MDQSRTTVKIAIVDEQEYFREALSLLLDREVSLNLVGVLSDCAQLSDMMTEFDVDVAVMDVDPGVDGAATTASLRQNRPGLGIVLLTNRHDSASVRELLKGDTAGTAVLLKQSLRTQDELVKAIHDVAAGLTVLDPAVVQHLTAPAEHDDALHVEGLTDREQQVLSLLARANTNSNIARNLDIELRTVENHINNVFRKLGIPPDAGKHPRVSAALTYLTQTRRLDDID